jgi:hypothetical protein
MSITFPTNVGRLRIEVGATGPVAAWRGPEVFFSVDGMPIISVSMQDGAAVVDLIGHDPRKFDELPEDLQVAAAWWQRVLPTIAAAWDQFTASHLTDRADAA